MEYSHAKLVDFPIRSIRCLMRIIQFRWRPGFELVAPMIFQFFALSAIDGLITNQMIDSHRYQ